MSTNQHLAVFGATSAIAIETTRRFAEAGHALTLVGRSPERLESLKNDMMTRGASSCEIIAENPADFSKQEEIVNKSLNKPTNHVLVAYGVLGDQNTDEKDVVKTREVIDVNFTSQATLCLLIAEKLKEQKKGLITVISSVAGDRGRQSNFIYGSSKSGMSAFLQGLRNRLYPDGIDVLDVKPGFVDTPMTAHLAKKTLPATPQTVGQDIYKAMNRKRPFTLYTPFFWRYIMMIIRNVPESIFRKLKT